MTGDIFRLRRTPALDTSTSKDGSSNSEKASRESAETMKCGSAASATAGAHGQDDALLDVPQVAEYLRVSRSSVYKLIERQQIPAIRIGRLLRVRKAELDETLRVLGTDI
jgi:excisionase family DNA binding protein